MSDDQPPSEQLPIFNPVNFKGTSNQSLNYPIAQGVETFPGGIVFGDGSFQNTAAPSTAAFVQYPTAQGQVTFPSIAFADGTTQSTAANTSTNYIEFPTAQGLCSFPSGITNVGDITQVTGSTSLNSTTFNGTITQAIGSTSLGNTTINGNSTLNGNFSQTTGNCSLQAAIIDGSADINGAATVTTNFGTSSNINLKAVDSTTSKSINLLPSVTAGAYNPATEAGDIQVLAFKSGSQNTETLDLTTWSSTNSAVKIKPTSVEIGAGGLGVTGTSNILCDGTTVNISPSVTYPDTTVQNSAFTGAGSLAGSYTSADVTINSNGQITAISNGTGSAPNIVYSPWASSVNFASGFNSGTVVSVALTPGTWQLIGVLAVTIGGGASFNPSGNVSNPYALCSINQPGGGSIAIGTIASPSNGATWSGGSGQIYTYVQTVVTITSNSTYTLQYNVRVDLTTGYMSIPNISPPSYLRAIQLG